MSNPKHGWVVGLLAALCFAGMSVVVGHSDSTIHSGDYLFGRALFAVIAMLPFLYKHYRFDRDFNFFVVARGMVSTFVFLISFWLIQEIGSAPARTISATNPFFVFILGIFLFDEKLTKKKVLSITLFLVGLLFPIFGRDDPIEPWMLCVGLLGAALSGLSLSLLKLATQKSPERVILFTFGLIQLLVQLLAGPLLGNLPVQPRYEIVFGVGLWPCVAVGAFACAGQLLMSKSFRSMSSTAASLLNLTSIPLTYLIEYLVYGKTYGGIELLMSVALLLSLILQKV
ncbi:MAG: EamA family transporter [Bdellovibrionales bacterium]|nr:EamA family transporter [Bdellovibrionales bacterium]